jgi:hypothetical protein
MQARDRDANKPLHGAERRARTPVNHSTHQLPNGTKTPADVRRDPVKPSKAER